MSVDEVKKKVMNWSGLLLEGATKEELRGSLKGISWSLECELDQERKILEEEIEKLDIPEI